MNQNNISTLALSPITNPTPVVVRSQRRPRTVSLIQVDTLPMQTLVARNNIAPGRDAECATAQATCAEPTQLAEHFHKRDGAISFRNDAPSVLSVLTPRTRTSPKQNRLLDAIPEMEWRRLSVHLTPVELNRGDVICEPGNDQPYVYFPTDMIVSLLYETQDGASAEIAVVGNEGLVGISLLMGGGTCPGRAVVQSAGQAFRMRAQFIRDEFSLGGAVQQLLLRYTQALLTQMGQTAVCNRHHVLDQQLCRWLLMSLDRLSSDEVKITQESIAGMLGVRREGITAAAGKLQRAGVIEYIRGRIRVLDRAGLESRACECYAVVRKEFARLLPSQHDDLAHVASGTRRIANSHSHC